MLLQLPFNRKLESEADHIGLLLMARSCYDYHEAPKLWERMIALQGREPELLKYFSTHPSHGERIKHLVEWMPEAEKEAQKATCALPDSPGLFGRWMKGDFHGVFDERPPQPTPIKIRVE